MEVPDAALGDVDEAGEGIGKMVLGGRSCNGGFQHDADGLRRIAFNLADEHKVGRVVGVSAPRPESVKVFGRVEKQLVRRPGGHRRGRKAFLERLRLENAGLAHLERLRIKGAGLRGLAAVQSIVDGCSVCAGKHPDLGAFREKHQLSQNGRRRYQGLLRKGVGCR